MAKATRIDHPGFVVSDLDAAVDFLTAKLGMTVVRTGDLGDPAGDTTERYFGIHRDATGKFAFLAAGDDQVELLQWQGVEQAPPVGNSDLGGRHLALAVDDLEAVLVELAQSPGVVLRERHPRGFIYVSTPFGLELQLVPA